MVDFSSPLLWNFPYPPDGGRLPSTSCSCTYWPRRIDERDGQHSESVTKKFENVVPFCTSCELTFGNRDGSRYEFRSRSSVRMKTMFGFLADLACGTPEVDAPAVVVSDAAVTTNPSGMTRNRARRRLLTDPQWRGPVSEGSASHHEPVKCATSARA